MADDTPSFPAARRTLIPLTDASTDSPGYFDFVYLDADHRYESVRAHLHAIAPKLSMGGRVPVSV